MHRTQIYFEEPMFEELKAQANALGLSLSAYIRDTLRKDLNEKKRSPKPLDLTDFSGIWKDRDITQESIRQQAWK
jgi:hypothetical protein